MFRRSILPPHSGLRMVAFSTTVVGNRYAQFRVATLEQQSFHVTLCVTSNLEETHFRLNFPSSWKRLSAASFICVKPALVRNGDNCWHRRGDYIWWIIDRRTITYGCLTVWRASCRVLLLVSLHTTCNNIWDFVGSETIQHKQASQTRAYFSPTVMYGYDIVH
jgi:hypothetical protein